MIRIATSQAFFWYVSILKMENFDFFPNLSQNFDYEILKFGQLN